MAMRTEGEPPEPSKRVRQPAVSAAAISDYLDSRPLVLRWQDWMRRRRYFLTHFSDRAHPLLVIAYSRRDAAMARQAPIAIEQDWAEAPPSCREAYDAILADTCRLIIVQIRRENVCACLGHRHPAVRERPFAEMHDVFGGVRMGEIDVAWRAVSRWQAQPISDTAMDTKFLEGSRLEAFHKKQFRLKLLSVILHEIHHLTCPEEPENEIREHSISFYHEALASYVESAMASLSLTIDRSFSRFG